MSVAVAMLVTVEYEKLIGHHTVDNNCRDTVAAADRILPGSRNLTYQKAKLSCVCLLSVMLSRVVSETSERVAVW